MRTKVSTAQLIGFLFLFLSLSQRGLTQQLGKVTNSNGMTFVLIPKGSFTMGIPPEIEGELDERRRVRFSQDFFLAVTETTQQQYQRIMQNNPSALVDPAYLQKFQLPPDHSNNYPVDSVSWNDAVEFCRRLSALPEEKAAGREYRLPTEAEWEYACRAGTDTAYSFGENEKAASDFAWYLLNSATVTNSTRYCKSQPSSQKKPNKWGVYDMHGNLWEWCSDWYGNYRVERQEIADPLGPVSGRTKVLRGGSWSSDVLLCKSGIRAGENPARKSSDFGFRIVMEFKDKGIRKSDISETTSTARPAEELPYDNVDKASTSPTINQVDHIIRIPEPNLSSDANTFYSVDWHPTEDILLTSSHGKIEVWDASNGRRLKLFEVQSDQYATSQYAFFSDDGKLIYTNLGGLKTIDIASGSLADLSQVAKTEEGSSRNPGSCDLKFGMLAHMTKPGWARVVDIASKQELLAKEIPGVGFPCEVLLTNAGKHLVVFSATSNDNLPPALQLIDIGTQEMEKTFSLLGHKGRVLTWAINAGAGVVATGAEDNTVMLWSYHDGRSKGVLRGHESPVISLSISRDGSTVVSLDQSHVIRVWNVETNKEVYSRGYRGQKPSKIAINPQGDAIALIAKAESTIPSSIRIFDWKTDSERGKAWFPVWAGGETERSYLAWDTNSRFVANAGYGYFGETSRTNGIAIFDVRTDRLSQHKADGYIESFGLQPGTDAYFVSYDSKNVIQFCNFSGSNKQNATLTKDEFNSMPLPYMWAWHPDGKRLFAVAICENFQTDESRIDMSVYSLPNKASQWLGVDILANSKPKLHFSDVAECRTFVSPNGKLAATYNPTGSPVEVWELATRSLKAKFEMESSRRIHRLAWSPDSNLLLAGLERRILHGSLAESVRAWNIEKSVQLAGELPEMDRSCRSLSIHPSGNYLAIADGSSTVTLWTIENEEISARGFYQADRYIHDVAFSPDGKVLAANGDGALLFWQCHNDSTGSPNSINDQPER